MSARNRLAGSTSPYLLQHAENPVDWYPWGEEAFQRSREEDKPILLSIGYSSCHWCHVMAHESFEDETTAALMNRHFVSIKVDREERPDLDDVYMAATLAMNHGQGGWPMTVFLTPDREPFFAGTYFPPEDRYGRPGFRTVLGRVAELWKTDRDTLKSQAGRIVDYLQENAQPAPGPSVGDAEIGLAVEQLARAFDARHGGFGPAPKFPPSEALRLLLRAHRRSGDPRTLAMVRTTLDGMAGGGIYDQIGGGFCRYSTDERWLVPHFEKMLYDNALLARAYLEGYQATGEPRYRRVATEVLDYVLREMTSPEGGFYSSTDADSEGVEGKFFVWTPAEIAAILPREEAERFCDYFDIREEGNWEGRSIPNVPDPLARVAERHGTTPEALARSLEDARAHVYAARESRVHPGLDDKILTAWNGLAIGALAEGFRVLGERRYLEGARRARDFIRASLRGADGRLLRTARGGRAHLDAYLEDHAYLAEGLLDLYEAGGDLGDLEEAEALAGILLDAFASEEGGFFATARNHEVLIVRHREGHDGAMPGANAVAAAVLARLAHHLDRTAFREQAGRAIRAYAKAIARQPRAFAGSLMVVDFLLEGPVELAFVGPRESEALAALERAVGAVFLPNRIVGHHDPEAGDSVLPLLRAKALVEGQPALYVCREFACREPITDPARVGAALEREPAPRTPAASGLSLPPTSGHATPEGTARYAGRFRDDGLVHGYRPLGRTGLLVSRVGFGGYRVDDGTPEHREALARALTSGCNVLDTSTNYTDGGSERLFGEVVGDLVRTGRLARDEVVIVSKIGYVQGSNLELARQREAAGEPFPEMVKYGEGIWHSIHPEFLADQLGRSLGRLGLETLDLVLLHNPEYFLEDAHERSDGRLETRRLEFDRRLREAFRFLESEVGSGRIRGYGVSSNTVTAPAQAPGATSLTRMLAAAEEAGGPGHHFVALQLPLNLLETGGVFEANSGEGGGRSVLAEAEARGIGVLANRPLNALDRGIMIRLADVSVPDAPAEVEEQLEVVGRLEQEYRETIATELRSGGDSLPPGEFFRWSRELGALLPRLEGLAQWDAIESGQVLPPLVRAVQVLDRNLAGPLGERWTAWRNRYLPALQRLMAGLRRRAAESSVAATRPLRAILESGLPQRQKRESLARQALWVVASLPGVSSVLLGMRRASYVDDGLAVLGWPPFGEPRALLDEVRRR